MSLVKNLGVGRQSETEKVGMGVDWKPSSFDLQLAIARSKK